MNQAHAPNRLPGLPWWLAYDRFIGVDIHKHYVTVVALDQQRQVLFHRRRIPLEWKGTQATGTETGRRQPAGTLAR